MFVPKSTTIDKNDGKQIEDRKEQVRDLMFFLETQNKLKDIKEVSQEKIEESSIVFDEAII